MILDLHCHSTCSDGSFAPQVVAGLAADRGAELFCLTDHDTCVGYEATRPALPNATVLRGMELSCIVHRRTVHILLLGLRAGPALDALLHRLESVQLDRRNRIVRICNRLDAMGYPIDPHPILAGAVGRTVGRPDVARALVAAGVCNSMREAFDRFLHDGGPADDPSERLDLAEGLALGRAAGAKASLAHPHTLGNYGLVRDVFERHRHLGLDGIEAIYGPYARAERQPWLKMAADLELVVTAGSDFHGEASPLVSRPGIELDRARADALRVWLDA